MGRHSHCYKNGLAQALARDELQVEYTAANRTYIRVYMYMGRLVQSV